MTVWSVLVHVGSLLRLHSIICNLDQNMWGPTVERLEHLAVSCVIFWLFTCWPSHCTPASRKRGRNKCNLGIV